jgi:protein involved in polysaccharide export with SLBB domain
MKGDPLSVMKNAAFVITLLAIVPTIGMAQTPSRQPLSPESTAQSESSTTRNRVVGPRVSNHADNPKSRQTTTPDVRPVSRSDAKAPQFVWGNTAIVSRNDEAAAVTPPLSSAANTNAAAATRPLVQPTVLNVSNTTTAPRPATVSVAPVATAPASPRSTAPAAPISPALYVVGAGDVLDIRLSNAATRESTLYTVLKNGAIEYPLLGQPLVVIGLTTDEIARTLTAQIKVIKSPKVSVNVRDYASHTVVITGLVDNPGTKILRRQAMPLYVLLAEASVRAEATTVTIVRNGKEGPPLALKDEQAMAALISSGDTIRIGGGTPASGLYVYVGGDVAAPGEKNFRIGMTLTQALLAAGANISTTRAVKVSRRNSGGLLSAMDYDVVSIAQGKTPDPPVFSGDRIEVKRAK